MHVKRNKKEFNPLLKKGESFFSARDAFLQMKPRFSSEAPAPFVGRFGYPNINIGILAPGIIGDDTWLHDATRHWSKHNFQIDNIVGLRSALVNSRFKTSVHAVRSAHPKLLDISQEVGMAAKPVEMEFKLQDKPKFRLNTYKDILPSGPKGQLEKARITANTKIDQKVDKIVAETDLKAVDAMSYLYKKGFDELTMSKLLSIGTLGVKTNRRLTPTRWSITATDDILGKQNLQKIKEYSTTDYLSFFGSYLGNYYLILCFSEPWSYELFESFMPSQKIERQTYQYVTDYESFRGRKTYAAATQGGYYAARLAITEELVRRKKQASVLCLRFITEEYSAPLGVFVVREACRKAMASKPITFGSKELMLTYANALVRKKFGYDLNHMLQNSKLVRQLYQQLKLTTYF